MAMNRRRLLAGGAALAAAGAGGTYLALRNMGSMAAYDDSVAASRAALTQAPETAEFVRYATLAANSHNTQPWRFRIRAGGIDILPDMTRRLAIVDPDDHHLFASLGCAAENLAIASGARGRPGVLGFDPAKDGAVTFTFASAPDADPAMVDAIPKRQSTRGDYDGRPVGVADLRALVDAAAMPGVDVVLITDRPGIDRIRDLVVAGNSAQMADPAFMRELKAWLRFSPAQAMRTGDGLFGACSGHPALPVWLGATMVDLVVTAAAENAKYARQLASSAGIAVFLARGDDPAHWVQAGLACQRFALRATALGLKTAFVNQPVEVAGLRSEMAGLAGLPGRRPDIVMRFGYGPALPYSARRPVTAVLA